MIQPFGTEAHTVGGCQALQRVSTNPLEPPGLNDTGWSQFEANQPKSPGKSDGVALSCTGAFRPAC